MTVFWLLFFDDFSFFRKRLQLEILGLRLARSPWLATASNGREAA